MLILAFAFEVFYWIIVHQNHLSFKSVLILSLLYALNHILNLAYKFQK